MPPRARNGWRCSASSIWASSDHGDTGAARGRHAVDATRAGEEAQATLDAAFAGGIRYADTAPYYGFGLAEKRLGAAAAGRELAISTKVGRLLRPVDGPVPEERHCYHSPEPFDPVYDYRHDAVLRSHAESLKRLARDSVDLLFVHDIGRTTHGDAHSAMLAQLIEGGGLAALERLRDEGAIHGFGLGVNEIDVCLELMGRAHLDVILLAGRYTLLEQGALDALLPRCLLEGTSIVIGGPIIRASSPGVGSGPIITAPRPRR